jgi:hypothetical protein
LWFPTRDDGSVGFQFKADALDWSTLFGKIWDSHS